MGLTYATVRLKNGTEKSLARLGQMPEANVSTIDVNFLVDTGAYNMAINQVIADQLGLIPFKEEMVTTATGELVLLPVVGPIWVEYLTRSGNHDAFVLSGNSEPLFGAIQLEALDLIVDPLKQELTTPPDRPNKPVHIMKGFRKV